jgi:hypothetical protein
MSRTPAAALLVLLALGLPSARAENASAPLLAGDRLHGNVLTPGDGDLLSLYLPAGTLFSVDLLAEKDSAILPGLVATDPADEVMDLTAFTLPGPGGIGLKVRNASAGPAGGTFSFLASGTAATSGKYSFRLTAKMPRKTFGNLSVPAGMQGEFTFDAPAGSKLAWSVKPPKGVLPDPFTVSLRDPALAVSSLGALSGKKRLLDQDGTWALLVDNAGGTGETLEIVATLTLPKTSKRELFLSPTGFGPAPKVKTATPKKVLDDRVAEGVAVTGEGFDPAALVRLEKKGQEPIEAANLVIADTGHFTADFDVVGVADGGWKIVVENPSGGRGSLSFTVQSAGSVKLPPGIRTETEAWWLDFDEPAFRADLTTIGLGSSSPDTAALAEAAVKSYALYWLRLSFGLDPATGKPIEGSVPVSFGLLEAPATVGAPGTAYNRLLIGGTAAGGDPSTNPNYAWGDGPLDTGNLAYDDIGAAQGAGVRTGALLPTLAGSVGGYYLALKPLLDTPLTLADLKYFFRNFNPASEAEGTRYRDISAAVNAAGKEIAGTIAHFVGRAMGVADAGPGLSMVPTKVGEFATLATFGFTPAETAALTAAVRAGIPGKARTLQATWFGLRETVGYLLPDATTTKAYQKAFQVAGGRPDLAPGDLEFQGIAGSIPAGFMVTGSGVLQGTAPLRYIDNSLVGGVYRFLVRARDKGMGESILFSHRLNLLVDVNNVSLSPTEVFYGGQLNTMTVNTP